MFISTRHEIATPAHPPAARSHIPLLAGIAALTALYFCTGKLGLKLAFLNENATAVWPPTGIALAAFLLFGRRLWPGVWLGAFLVNITTSGSFPATIVIATGNTLEPLLGAWLVERFAGGRRAFEHARDCLLFVGLAAILSTAVSATFGVTSLALAEPTTRDNYSLVWLTWWLGDMVSAVIVTPLLLIWATSPQPREPRPRLAEAAILLAVLLSIGMLVFGGLFGAPVDQYPQSFLFFPPLLWAAFRFGQRGAITAAFVLSAIAIWGTLRGFGPFALDHPNESLVVLQAFMGTITVTNLLLGAVVSERQRAAESLMKSEQHARTRSVELQAAERRLAGNLAVARILAESPASDEALPRVLQTVCETLGWEMGALWTPDADSRELHCLKVWHNPAASAGKFLAITSARTFSPGVGLPGRVWSNRAPAWIPDVTKDQNFPRAPYAVAEGLHAAFGFPILAGDKFLAVLEFFSHEIREPDEALLAMFGGIGGQVGQFLARQQVEEARTQAEEAVRSSQEQLQLVTDCMSVPVVRCSRDLKFLWVSKAYADWRGRTADEIVGRSIVEVLGQESLERLQPHIERVLSGESVRYEEEVTFPKKDRGWVSVAYSPTLDPAGNVDGFVAAVIDIDTRKRAEEALKEADRRKDEFLAILAHELRNPLAPVRTALTLMRKLVPAVPEIADLRDIIERQVSQMARLLDDLLDVSRITSGKIELRKDRISLGNVLTSAVEASRPFIEAQHHRLTVAMPAEPLYLDADMTRLSQVFSNLLNNAAKYTDKGGQIGLTVERMGSDVVVHVRDNGIGIPADKLPHIFEMFVQADKALERAHGGLGVGLTLVRRLLEMHGGRIEAISEGQGKGSEFIVRLPLLIEYPARAADARDETGETRSRPPLRILVADDNVDAANLMARCLRMLGHDTVPAYDGLAALEAAASFKPDVALLDIGMPKLNGYDVARRIRAEPNGKGVFLVAMTGWGQDSDKRRAVEAGFDEHLTKPADIQAIEKLLARLARAEA